MATVTTIDKTYDIPESILSQYEVKPVPVIDRMEVLRGEWIPRMRQEYYVANGSELRAPCFQRIDHRHGSTPYGEGEHRFFPSKELAEEYLLIAEGKWVPRHGEYTYEYSHTTGNTFEYSRGYSFGAREGRSYFPSAKQRDEYIARNKKAERPLVGKEATIGGVTYILR